MTPVEAISLVVLLAILALVAYVDRIYSEMGKFLAREYQDNIDAWEQVVEPRLRLGRESVALSASILRQLTVATLGVIFGLRLFSSLVFEHGGAWSKAGITACELILVILIFDRLIPQVLFTRTRGLWIARIRIVLEVLFYVILPITMLLQLLLSIAALAEPEDTTEEDHPSEAMDALLEAGEEEGILEESDRELVRSVIEFGDKVVREVMTPRPEIIAVPGNLTLQQFTEVIHEYAFSRIPIYTGSLDHITGIAFAHDLLHIYDTEARTKTVASIQRPVAFVPEVKKVAELLREMQREKQHMRIVIDEYGGVAGLVTIEDLLEAIVGNIADEHDIHEPDDVPVREANGAYVVSGSFELSRLRDLFADQFETPSRRAEADSADSEDNGSPHNPADSPEAYDLRDTRDDPTAIRLPEHYESTTIGGLVSEIAGHIPLPGEVVEEEGLRLEVLASTDRRIDRVRVSLATPPTTA
jgi:CBS domain containing-hemolysin-like protein